MFLNSENSRGFLSPFGWALLPLLGETKVNVIKYKNFLIVSHNGKVDILNPYNDHWRVVKSTQAAKWRITRALRLVERVRGLV